MYNPLCILIMGNVIKVNLNNETIIPIDFCMAGDTEKKFNFIFHAFHLYIK